LWYQEKEIAMNGQSLVETVSGSTSTGGIAEALRRDFGLCEAIERLGNALSLPSLLETIAREFRAALKSELVAVCINNQGRWEWPVVLDSGGGPGHGSGLRTHLLPPDPGGEDTDGADWRVLGQNVAGQGRSKFGASGRRYVFPMRAGADRLGQVYVECRSGDPEPPAQRMQFLAQVSHHAALLMEHLQMAETRRELDAARQIQLQLFPRTLDLDPRLDIAARNHPAFAVSGDYYDCQLAAPGKVAFIIADVMGHGLAAASMMMRVHAVFRKAVQQGRGLEGIDWQLNAVMKAVGEDERFATGIIGICDMEARRLSLVCAGHPWPSILLDGRRMPVVSEACTFPWGLPAKLRSPARPACIPLGERFSLLAYTDGLTATRAADGRPCTSSCVEQVHWRNLDCGARKLCDTVFNAALRHPDPVRTRGDDITVLAMCSKPWRKAARLSQRLSLAAAVDTLAGRLLATA
jgi:serine phosphatase RsbU (regulator of sigma subunit)